MSDLTFSEMFPELNPNQIKMFKRYMAELIEDRIAECDTEDARYNLRVVLGDIEEL